MFWSPDSIRPELPGSPRAAADVDQLFGRVGDLDGFDRPPMEMQAGLGELVLRLAEAQLDRHFVRLHGIDRLEYPERHQRQARSGR